MKIIYCILLICMINAVALPKKLKKYNSISCKDGQYVLQTYSGPRCQDCPRHYYCPNQVSIDPCANNEMTLSTKSTSRKSCIPIPCKDGEYYDVDTKKCVICDYNYFCLFGRDLFQCPTGFITYSKGANNRELCKPSPCSAGQYWILEKKQCFDCEANYYCPDRISKIPCPNGQTTRGKTRVREFYYCV